jgi:hypothetical protein
MVLKKEMVKKTYEKEEIVSVICDLCGKEDSDGYWVNEDGEGQFIDSGICESIVQHEMKIHYQETYHENWPGGGGESASVSVDLCPHCLIKRFIPWVEEQSGKKIESRKWYF